jgi:dUTP pyrophosphatase
MWEYVEHYWEDNKDAITIIFSVDGLKKNMSFTRETYEMLSVPEDVFVKRVIDKCNEPGGFTERKDLIKTQERNTLTTFNNFYFNVMLDNPDAQLPTIAYEGDAGWDLYASKYVNMIKRERYLIPTGIKTEFSKGYVALVRDRGSGPKTHFVVAGVIDSGYRGEWFVQVFATKDHIIYPGDKIAQFLVMPVWSGVMNQVIELGDSERGEKRLGSSNFK